MYHGSWTQGTLPRNSLHPTGLRAASAAGAASAGGSSAAGASSPEPTQLRFLALHRARSIVDALMLLLSSWMLLLLLLPLPSLLQLLRVVISSDPLYHSYVLVTVANAAVVRYYCR